MRLKTRILLLVGGTVLLLVTIWLAVLTPLAAMEMRALIRSDSQATSDLLRFFFEARRTALRERCELLAEQTSLRQYILAHPDVREDWATVSEFARSSSGRLRAQAVRITDSRGRVLGDSEEPKATAAAQERSAGDLVRSALGGNPTVGLVPRRGKLMLAVSVPVRDPVSQYTTGTLTAYVAILEQMLADVRKVRDTDVILLNDGAVAAATLTGKIALMPPSPEPRMMTHRSVRYLAYDASLPVGGLAQIRFIVLRRADSGPAAAFARLRLAVLGTGIGILALAVLAGRAVARGLTRPLEALVSAARRLQRGDWPEPLGSTRSDEIGLLQEVFDDMTGSLRRSQERLLALIDSDPLTELLNHRRFQERLRQEMERAQAAEEPLAMALLDIDRFHEYNQRHGHHAGDALLVEVATRLRAALPTVAIAARYGGDEFAVLLPRQGGDAAEAFARRLRETLAGEMACSIGIAERGVSIHQGDALMLAAELALTQAKQFPQERLCRFDAVTDAGADPFRLHDFLRDGSLATIQALAAAVDAKDPYTRGHSQRVAEYAASLARHLGLGEHEAELVFTAGTLHDVGKIGVPDAILRKPGRLTEDERIQMQSHPVLGEVIVRKAPQLTATLPGVRHHHERWDGRGYPDGLAGTQIPRIARILALADTFDAMCTDRPYRKGLRPDEALAEIRASRGTQFDPELADAFVALMSRAAYAVAA